MGLREAIDSKKSSLISEAVEIQDRRGVLLRQIQKWQEIQSTYIPGYSQVNRSGDELLYPEKWTLFLPSQVPRAFQVIPNLAEMEKQIRIAQCNDSIAELCRLLRVLQGLKEYKRLQVAPSQRTGTRAWALISRFQSKIKKCANQYRLAYSALTKLDAGGAWSNQFFPLMEKDVQILGRRDPSESEGYKEVSWIWMTRRLPENGEKDCVKEDTMDDGMCIQ